MKNRAPVRSGDAILYPVTKSVLAKISVFLALAASVFLLVYPSGSGYWGGEFHRTTLLQSAGQGILVLLAFPVVLTLLPVLFPKRAIWIGAAFIIWAFAILGGFSIGFFYIPAAGAVLLGACVDSPATPG